MFLDWEFVHRVNTVLKLFELVEVFKQEKLMADLIIVNQKLLLEKINSFLKFH
jgi:hypothetical protein